VRGVRVARCKVGLDMAKPPREMLAVLLRSGDGRVVPTNQQEETGMEATVEAPSTRTRKDCTSRPGALSRFFRMSREGWKSKYKALKATVKTEECLLSGVSPLGDMVGHARSYHTCQSSHGGKLTRPQPRVKS